MHRGGFVVPVEVDDPVRHSTAKHIEAQWSHILDRHSTHDIGRTRTADQTTITVGARRVVQGVDHSVRGKCNRGIGVSGTSIERGA